MKEYILAFTSILENPFIEKGYRELKKCYEKNGQIEEMQAIEFLLKERFRNDVEDSDSSRE